MKKISSPIVLILCFILGACSAILGENGLDDELMPLPDSSFLDEAAIEGTPNQNLFGVNGGYYIWKNGNVFSLRIARPSALPHAIPAPVFEGTIRISRGMVKWVKQQNLTTPNETRFTGESVDYRIELIETIGGFDFEIRPRGIEYCVLFDVRYNGVVMPEIVHLGKSLQVPDALPLDVCFR